MFTVLCRWISLVQDRTSSVLLDLHAVFGPGRAVQQGGDRGLRPSLVKWSGRRDKQVNRWMWLNAYK